MPKKECLKSIKPKDMPELETRVIRVVAYFFKKEAGDISTDDYFVNDLMATDLDLVDIFMELEKEFDVDIDDENREKLIDVKLVIKFLSIELKLSL